MATRTNRACHLVAALALAAVLVACGPQAQPFANGTVKMAGPIAVALAIQPNPPRAGQDADLRFTLNEQNQPVSAARATAQLWVDMPKMSMSLPDVPLQSDGAGHWRARVTFPMAGGWAATLKVNVQGTAPAEATFQFDVGP